MNTFFVSSGNALTIAVKPTVPMRLGYAIPYLPSKAIEVSTLRLSGPSFLSSDKSLTTVLYSLADKDFVLRKPLYVDLDFDAYDEVTALFEPAGIAMSGSSVQDALQGLKDEFVDTYNLYKNEPNLGPEPERRLRVLEQYIEQRRHAASKGGSRVHS